MNIRCQGRSVPAEFHVVKGNRGRLLSYRTSRELGLVPKLGEDNDEDHQVGAVDKKPVAERVKIDPKMARWVKEFPSVFTDKIGVLKNADGTDFELQLHIDKSVKPIQARPRTQVSQAVPFARDHRRANS